MYNSHGALAGSPGTSLIFFMKYWEYFFNAVPGSTKSFTIVSGGNVVDGLPPAFNYV